MMLKLRQKDVRNKSKIFELTINKILLIMNASDDEYEKSMTVVYRQYRFCSSRLRYSFFYSFEEFYCNINIEIYKNDLKNWPSILIRYTRINHHNLLYFQRISKSLPDLNSCLFKVASNSFAYTETVGYLVLLEDHCVNWTPSHESTSQESHDRQQYILNPSKASII